MQFDLTTNITIDTECLKARSEGRQISSTIARMIANQWCWGTADAGFEFGETGAISTPLAVWNDLFTDSYAEMSQGGNRRAADMLGAYLWSAGSRGAVDGWGDLETGTECA
jgi:hypothetical protein